MCATLAEGQSTKLKTELKDKIVATSADSKRFTVFHLLKLRFRYYHEIRKHIPIQMGVKIKKINCHFIGRIYLAVS